MAKKKELPGMETPTIPDIDNAAELWIDAEDKSKKLKTKAKELHEDVLEAMHNHDLTTYEFDGYVINVDAKERVKAKRKPGKKATEDEGEKKDQ